MITGEFWNAIHGAYPLDNLEHAKLTKRQKELAVSFGIPLDEIYNMPNSFTPLIWFKEGLMVDLAMMHKDILAMMRVRERVEGLTKMLAETKGNGLYCEWFRYMDKKFIIPMLVREHRNIPDERLYDVFEEVWTRSEVGFQMFTEDVLRHVFSTRKHSKEWARRMREFRKDIKNHPEYWVIGPNGKKYLHVYHGEQNGEYNPGDLCSWTLQYKTAEFFAYRFDNYEYGEIQERLIQPKEALDYFTSRNEAEVLLWPEEWEPIKG